MNTGVIAVRYARALLKCALEMKLEKEVYQEMMILSDCFMRVADFKQTISNPLLNGKNKQSLIETACGNNTSELTKNFISLVLRGGRENILQYMAASYITLYRQQKNIICGKLITATAVTTDIQNRMEQLIHSKSAGTIQLQSEINSDIIGGFILEYDSYRMDASVQTQLTHILKQLKK